jgi:hypothetical protein
MNTNPELPRWIIDTSQTGHIFCTHTREPRFTGEIFAPDDLPDEGGYGIAGTRGNWLVLKEPPGFYEEQDMYDSLKAALKRHGVELPDNSLWRIDDTSEPGHIFCERTAEPRLRGELMPAEKAPPQGDSMPAPDNRVLANIQWLDDPEDSIDYDAWIDDGGYTVSESLACALQEYEIDKQIKEGENQRWPPPRFGWYACCR